VAFDLSKPTKATLRKGNNIARGDASNEKEISHGTVSWQARWTHFEVGPLASSIG